MGIDVARIKEMRPDLKGKRGFLDMERDSPIPHLKDKGPESESLRLVVA